jgi:hypothetical protein
VGRESVGGEGKVEEASLKASCSRTENSFGRSRWTRTVTRHGPPGVAMSSLHETPRDQIPHCVHLAFTYFAMCQRRDAKCPVVRIDGADGS